MPEGTIAKTEEPAVTEGLRRLSPTELEEYLRNVFTSADLDGSGVLSITEFKEVFKMFSLNEIGLDDAEAQRVMAEADVNGDGQISFAEFVPAAVDLVQAVYAKADATQQLEVEADKAGEDAKDFMLHGMSKEELERTMKQVFIKADADGSGSLSLDEFHKCLGQADLGLTRQEINGLMREVDTDGDGVVTYEECVPICFDMCVELLKDKLKKATPPSELQEQLTTSFAKADQQKTGQLGVTELHDLIQSADFGLSRLQIHSIVAEVECDGEGYADYVNFAPVAAKMIYSMLDVETQLERHAAVQQLTKD